MSIFKNTEEIIPSGSILMFKRYNIFKRLWYKLRKKHLPYNDFIIWDITSKTSIFTVGVIDTDFKVYSPIKPYSHKEIFKLLDILYVRQEDCETEQDIINIVNSIRKNTITNNSLELLDSNPYYYKLI